MQKLNYGMNEELPEGNMYNSSFLIRYIKSDLDKGNFKESSLASQTAKEKLRGAFGS